MGDSSEQGFGVLRNRSLRENDRGRFSGHPTLIIWSNKSTHLMTSQNAWVASPRSEVTRAVPRRSDLQHQGALSGQVKKDSFAALTRKPFGWPSANRARFHQDNQPKQLMPELD
jgi:hypothetical protein